MFFFLHTISPWMFKIDAGISIFAHNQWKWFVKPTINEAVRIAMKHILYDRNWIICWIVGLVIQWKQK